MEIVFAALPIIGVILLIIILASGYVKAPPDIAFVISGLKKQPKVLIGRAGIKIPFLERKDVLMLKQISIDIKTNGYIPTNDFIGVNIDAVAKVRVLTDRDIPLLMSKYGGTTTLDEKGNKVEFTTEYAMLMIEAAMRNFLNMSEENIILALTDSLQGNMREIIGTQSLRNLCQNRKAFGDEVQDKAQKDMNALGIWIESCNIQKLEDEKELINALGMDNMAQIQKDASVAKAQAEKEIAVAEAEAKRIANDAKVISDIAIAEKQNELNIRNAELKKISDTKKAEADAAFSIQEQEQRKTIEIASANADIAKQEKEVELKQKEVSVKEQTLNAEVKKQAEADKYAAQQRADAELYKRQKEAEAKKYEVEQQAAALKAEAEAQKYSKEQEAEGIRAVGLAEAESIKAKALAEAEGIEKKAEAQAKMKSASVLEMYFQALPQIAENVAKPLEKIGNITMFGDGNNSKMIEDITKATNQISSGFTQGMGLDIAGMLSKIVNDGSVDVGNVKVSDNELSETIDKLKGVVASAKKSDNSTDVVDK